MEKTDTKVMHAEPKDAAAILKLKQAAWLKTYPSQKLGITANDIYKKLTDDDIAEAVPNWQKAIAGEKYDGDIMTFVAKIDGKVVGYTQPCTEDGKRVLGAMYVLPEAQGKGIGGKLIRKAIEWHGFQDDIYANVISYNHDAIKFYEHFGFRKTGKELPQEVDKNGLKLLPEIEMVLKKSS
jgi:GNAT superfamily N-acetyltransferase